MDARKMYETKEIRWEEIQEGDWIKPKKWGRARRVELIEYRDGKRMIFLACPDQPETPREIDLDGFIGRAVTGKEQSDADPVPVWFAFPTMRKVWEKAHDEAA